MQVLGGITHLLHVSTGSAIFEPTTVDPFKLFRSVQGDIGRGNDRCEGAQGTHIQGYWQVEQGRHHIQVLLTPTFHAR